MKQPLHQLLFACLVVCALAAPAEASGVVDGDGYSLRLPAGFQDAPQKEAVGGARIRSRFGSMPLEGSPQVQAWISGSADRPAALLLVARLDLRTPIDTHRELGLRQLQAMDARVPEGFDFDQLRIDGRDAIAMEFTSEVDGEPRTTRVVTVACGSYLVVMMLDTADERFGSAQTTWNDLTATLKIVPRIQRLIRYGLIALGGLLAIGLLLRFTRNSGTRTRRGRHESGLVLPGSGGAPYSEIQAGVRGTEVRRPQHHAPPARKGLRSTLENDRR